MSADPDVLVQLARESGRSLAEFGVRPEDVRWIREHAETIATLSGRKRRTSAFDYFVRLARKAARKAR